MIGLGTEEKRSEVGVIDGCVRDVLMGRHSCGLLTGWQCRRGALLVVVMVKY